AEVVVQRELSQGRIDGILDANRNCHQERLGSTRSQNLSLDLCGRPKWILLKLLKELLPLGAFQSHGLPNDLRFELLAFVLRKFAENFPHLWRLEGFHQGLGR